MSNRSLAVLLAVVGALALSVLGFWYFSRPAQAPALWAAGLPAKADRLEIAGPAGKASFSRSGTAWRMEQPIAYGVDSGAIQALLDKLPDVRLSDELSADPARYALFGVDDSSATLVRVVSSSKAFEPLEFLIGKEGADMDSSYLRFPGKPGVVQASGISASGFARPVGDWLDKLVCSPPLAEVDELSVRSKEGKFSLRLAGGAWHAGAAKVALSTPTVDRVVRPAVDAAKGLTADKILPAADAPKAAVAELAQPDLTLEARASGGRASCSLKLGKKDPTGFRLVERKGEGRLYYQIYDWRLEPFRKKELLKLR